MKFENTLKNLCVICANPITDSGLISCLKCNKPCETNINELKEQTPFNKDGNIFTLYDVKSKCCNYDIKMDRTITCSPVCHKIFIEQVENKFEMYKTIIDQETGIAYKVPVKVIVEKGIRHEELKNYPKWDA